MRTEPESRKQSGSPPAASTAFCLPSSAYCLLLTAFCLLPTSPARAADTIEVRGTTAKVSGEIQSESPTEVTIRRLNGQTETIPVDQIVDIQYNNQPIKAAQARIHEQSGGARL